MREILFRAKRRDNGEWVEGAYCSREFEVIGNIYDNPELRGQA